MPPRGPGGRSPGLSGIVAVSTLLLLVVVALPHQAFAAAGAPTQGLSSSTLTSPNATSGGEFGISVAASGTIAVVGAPDETAAGDAKAGNVYAFSAINGSLDFTLTSPNAQVGGDFGYAVAASPNYVVVGAPEENSSGNAGAGNAYVFSATTGKLLFTLTSPDPQSGGLFGFSVATSGSYAVVGAYRESTSGIQYDGHAYIFNAGTGKLLFTLTSPVAQAGGRFGYSVAVSEGNVIVGAYHETANGLGDGGNVYIFDASTGVLTYTLQSPNVVQDGYFGYFVAANGTSVVVGAVDENSNGVDNTGRAYVFDANTGTLLFALTSPNAEDGGQFGRSVSVSGAYVVVGAPEENGSGLRGAGNVYVYSPTIGSLLFTLTNPNAQAAASFGWSVATSGTLVVSGAWLQNSDGQMGAGEAYIFSASALTSTSTTSTSTTPEFNNGALLVVLLSSMSALALVARRRPTR